MVDLETDVDLVKVIHKERLSDHCELHATINRFGSLSVFIFHGDDGYCIYQSDNILNARKWFRRNEAHIAKIV